MAEPRRILILGGTAEARDIAARLASDPRYDPISSLAGRTHAPERPDGEVRIGGFGGAEALAAYLAETEIDAVIDATHPFAARISANAEVACRRRHTPRLALLRPPWEQTHADQWISAEDDAEAARIAATLPAPIFLAIGRQSLDAYAGLGRTPIVLRTVDAMAEPPLPNCQLVAAKGPFSLKDELTLFERFDVASLVCRNSGGESGWSKLVAARHRKMPVVMIERPTSPEPPLAQSIEDVVAWLEETPMGLI